MMKPWRNSASSIILIKNAVIDNNCAPNFKLLLQERSSKSTNLPNTLVFPGGVESPEDSHDRWLDHFKRCGFGSLDFGIFQNFQAKPTQIFQEGGDPISRHISLRITAIRELFEEIGILVCKKKDEPPKNKSQFWASCIKDIDIPHWQKKVHNDPQNFLTLCKELDCYPDIWSMYLWSNWLTPTQGRKFRFDTIFFMVAFEEKPPIHLEENEVADYTLSTPEDTLRAFDKGEIEIIFPQWYELSRLKRHQDINKLIEFAAARSPYGSELFFPIRQKIKDGLLSVLPGDELYPKNPDLITNTIVCDEDKAFEELYSSTNNAHRVEFYDDGRKVIRVKNYTPQNSHIDPCSGDLPNIGFSSKTNL